VQYAFLDPPSILFTSGVVLPDIPQGKEDMEFGREDLRASYASGVYEQVGAAEVAEILQA
jgi:hypothetical protein